ncbi:hypothetical protein L1887_01962 [Cichorium endivia]|nr:hypothetical protein L1887_01962 [Cichorium endivia]
MNPYHHLSPAPDSGRLPIDTDGNLLKNGPAATAAHCLPSICLAISTNTASPPIACFLSSYMITTATAGNRQQLRRLDAAVDSHLYLDWKKNHDPPARNRYPSSHSTSLSHSQFTITHTLIDERLNYVEQPVAILDRETKTLRNKTINLVKVQWRHRRGSEWTWKPEDEMRAHYPDLFVGNDFEDEVRS